MNMIIHIPLIPCNGMRGINNHSYPFIETELIAVRSYILHLMHLDKSQVLFAQIDVGLV